MTEQELTILARKGDQEAFAQLVRDNERRVYTLALRMCGSPEDALDLAQETFLRAWSALPNFRGGSSFSTWLYRLAYNTTIDFLRKNSLRRDVSVPLGEEIPDVPDHAADPQQILEQNERRRALEQGLARLPEHYRSVLVLREVSGLSYQEIAGALKLDLGTVKSRIARGAEAGLRHGKIPHCPGPGGAAKNFTGRRELFQRRCV